MQPRLRGGAGKVDGGGLVSGETILIILLLVGWFVLMRFVLPRLGVST